MMAPTVDAVSAPPIRREPWLRKTLLGLMFCSPLVLIFVFLVIAPITYMVYMGLDASIYPAIFSDPIFIQTLWNTVIFVGLAVNLKMLLSLVLSALFSQENRAARILAGVFLLPWAIPALSGILALRWMLNGQWGIVSKVLNDLGFPGYAWLVHRDTAIGAAITYHITDNRRGTSSWPNRPSTRFHPSSCIIYFVLLLPPSPTHRLRDRFCCWHMGRAAENEAHAAPLWTESLGAGRASAVDRIMRPPTTAVEQAASEPDSCGQSARR